MKTKLFLFFPAALLVACNAMALTLDDVSGVYSGKLTSTSATSVLRADQVTQIRPDGHVTLYIYTKGASAPQIVQGFLQLRDDGTFPVPDGDGRLDLKGKHLTMTIHFLARADGTPETTLEFQGHRTEKTIIP